MRTFMSCLLLVAFGGLLGADDKKDEKIDAKLLVGKWKPKEKAHFTEMEFGKGDDVTFTFLIKEKEEKVSSKYKLDGNRLVVTEEVGGVKSSVKSRILKLTETELVMVDEKNKQIAFVRAKGK